MDGDIYILTEDVTQVRDVAYGPLVKKILSIFFFTNSFIFLFSNILPQNVVYKFRRPCNTKAPNREQQTETFSTGRYIPIAVECRKIIWRLNTFMNSCQLK